jgi:hypothetical protein
MPSRVPERIIWKERETRRLAFTFLKIYPYVQLSVCLSFSCGWSIIVMMGGLQMAYWNGCMRILIKWWFAVLGTEPMPWAH